MRRIIFSSAGLAISLLAMACATEAPAPAVVTKVIDYRNGWYHPASGAESVLAISERYGRDAKLVAGLNQLELTSAPPPGTHVYIPPVHDRDEMKRVLERIRENPGLVPISPPDSRTLGAVAKAAPKRVTAAAPATQLRSFAPEIPRAEAAPRIIPTSSAPDLPEIEDETPAVEVAMADAAPTGEIARDMSKAGRQRVELRGAPPGRLASGRAVMATRAGGSGLFAWPVEGEVVESFTGSQGTMKGIVIRTEDRARIKAAGEGKVIFADSFEGYGKVMMIEHKDKYITVYGYCDSLSRKKGDKVKKGDAIALAGKPSASSDTEVFFQVRKDKTPVDPMKLLP